MATITNKQLRDLMTKAPPGTTPQGIKEALKAKGHTFEGEAEIQAPQSTQAQGNFFKQEFTGGAPRQENDGFFKGLTKDVFQTTLGSRGLAGVAQLPGKVIGQAGALKTKTQTAQSAVDLSHATTQLIKQRREESNPLRKDQLTRAINENLKTLNELNQAGGEVERFITTPRDAISTSANAALTVSTLGAGSLAKSGTLAATQRLAPKAVPAVSRALNVGKGVVPKAVEGGLAGAGFKASQNIEDEKPINEDTFKAFVLGAAVPVAIRGAGAGKDATVNQLSQLDSRIINSLIKPGKNSFAYGKNPGRAVAQEGLAAGSLDDLGQKVTTRKQEVGQQLEQTLAEGSGSINIADTLTVIDDAIEEASKFAGTNKALTTRLNTLKADLVNRFGNSKSMTPQQAAIAKREIGALAKWTGNASDDEVVNGVTQKVYGRINEQINDAVPDVANLNNRYGDLLAAEKAIEYRIQAQEKLNVVGLGDLITGLGVTAPATVASGGVAGLLAGVSAVALKKAIQSPRGKTTLANWLSKASPEAKSALMQKLPELKNVALDVAMPVLINSIEKTFNK